MIKPYAPPAPRHSPFRAAVAAVALLLFPGALLAQSAPAGNAHPESRAVSEHAVSNPFGPTHAHSHFDLEKKRRFAAEVDLSPLADLAVFHNGRVKIMDTLAREGVRIITGRRNYYDLEPVAGGHARKLFYDPLFTLLDTMIDPAYYLDKPLIFVEYLPLREDFLELAFQDETQRNWWKKQGRLTPIVIGTHFQSIAARRTDAAFGRALGKVMQSVQVYRNGWQNLELIAPAAEHEPWLHLSSLPPDSPVAVAAADLGRAWRSGDAAGVNAAVRALAGQIPAINSHIYPTTSRELERAYNSANPFEYGFWFYFLSLVCLLLAFGTGRRWLAAVGIVTLFAAIALHGAGFAARCIIAERFAIQNQFESMTGLSLFATLVGAALMIARRQWLFGAAAAAVGFLVLVTATQTGIPGVNIEREAAILNTSVLLKYHVTTVLVSYGLISLGMIVSVFYLATHYATRFRARAAAAPAVAVAVSASALGLDDRPSGPARVLSDLDTAQMIILQLAFWTLGVGILLGAWWADHSWGRWWAWDPKEVWALVTWIVYLIVIHLRFATGGNRALVTAWLSLVGFIVMLWCYFGVNLLLPGLHAYA